MVKDCNWRSFFSNGMDELDSSVVAVPDDVF